VSGFLFAFLAVLVAAAGARDQVLVAALTRSQGPRPMLLAIAIAGALAATAFAGWAAYRLGADMIGPARKALGGIALILAGGEMVLISPGRKPAEPTRSLFAAFLVLTAWQVSEILSRRKRQWLKFACFHFLRLRWGRVADDLKIWYRYAA